jgi:hypothetical protein
MTNNRPPPCTIGFGLVLAALGTVLAGCDKSTVQLVSYKDPYFPEHYRVELSECAYRVDPSGDIHAAGQASTQTESGSTTQYLYVHIFWTPKPGKTPADSTTADAVLRYVVSTDGGVAVYSGTGFAFPKPAFGGGLEIDIESGCLRLESHRGDLSDFLGDARVTGHLKARADPAEAAHLIRQAEQLAMP